MNNDMLRTRYRRGGAVGYGLSKGPRTMKLLPHFF